MPEAPEIYDAAAMRQRLLSLADPAYRDFQCRLIPTVDPATVIGVRTPALRALAKDFAASPQAPAFLAALPHAYYEENNLHGFLIERMKDYQQIIAALDAFLPFVDNWATCDLISPKAFKKHLPALLEQIPRWLASDHTYTIRFGVEMLMSFYLDEAFAPAQVAWVADLRSEEYYVRMMIAWYFATALAKQYEATIPYLQQRRLDPWSHNKAIQKALESYRVPAETKIYLRTLKVNTPR